MNIGHTSVNIIIHVQKANIKKHLDRYFYQSNKKLTREKPLLEMCGTKFFQTRPFFSSCHSPGPDLEKSISEFIRLKSKEILKYSFSNLLRRRMTLFLFISRELVLIGTIYNLFAHNHSTFNDNLSLYTAYCCKKKSNFSSSNSMLIYLSVEERREVSTSPF
jgi:hypothetical protein